MKKNIAIVMGGFSSEFDISVNSGNVVYKWLDRERYNPFRILITPDKWVLLDADENEYPVNRHDFSVRKDGEVINFDCVFNAIHGTPGEDGILQAFDNSQR